MHWMKFRKYYFMLSGIVLVAGIMSLLIWGLPLGLDFLGGAIAEYKINEPIATADLESALKERGLEVESISKTGDGTYLFRFSPLTEEEKKSLKEVVTGLDNSAEELRLEIVGAAFGPELIQKTIYALLISSGAILLWVAFQFKSIKFGSAAIAAMFHDTLVLVGTYSILGHFFGAEVDFLFVTAVLTTLSFSVHDTIVVYDRIRELQKKQHIQDIETVADLAVTETMVRSLNNSFTIFFMLLALVLLGGVTTRWFAVALFVGSVTGTYSSPFVAVPLLVTFDKIKGLRKKR